MSIYPKATAPITAAVLRASNDRAERWRVRCKAHADALAHIREVAAAANEGRLIGGKPDEPTIPLSVLVRALGDFA